MPPAVLLRLRVFFPRILLRLRHSPKKQLVVARASAAFAPGPERPECRRARRKIWRRPRFARPLEHTAQLVGRGRYRADKALLRGKESPGPACLFSGARAIRAKRAEALIVFRYRGDQAFCKILRHAIESRVLFFEETVHVGGNFVFVAKNEIVVV